MVTIYKGVLLNKNKSPFALAGEILQKTPVRPILSDIKFVIKALSGKFQQKGSMRYQYCSIRYSPNVLNKYMPNIFRWYAMMVKVIHRNAILFVLHTMATP